MKPNTRVYAFFDDVDVNDNCTAGIRDIFSRRELHQRLRDQVTVTSNAGAALTTDANGTVTGQFRIPGARRWNRYVPDGIGRVAVMDLLDLNLVRRSSAFQDLVVVSRYKNPLVVKSV